MKKGDILFTIDKRPYQAALDSAKADNVLADANLKRQLELRPRALLRRRISIRRRRTPCGRRRRSPQLRSILTTAPFVRQSTAAPACAQIDVGNTVSAGSGSAVLVQIDNLDPIYTDFTVAEPDLPLVRKYLHGPNLKVLTDAENDGFPAQEGELYFIANTVQPGTGRCRRAPTPNPKHQLWPSQFVHVRLVLDVLKNANGCRTTPSRPAKTALMFSS